MARLIFFPIKTLKGTPTPCLLFKKRDLAVCDKGLTVSPSQAEHGQRGTIKVELGGYTHETYMF